MKRLLLISVLALVAACGNDPTGLTPTNLNGAPSYGVSGRPDCPKCADLPHGSPDGSLLLVSYPGGAGGSSFTTSPTVPAGATFCLAHGDPTHVDLSKPLPSAILSDDVVGCDRVFAPGSSYVIDFDASNTPGFATFADRITNGVNDVVGLMVAFVDGALNSVQGGVSGGTIGEQDLTNRQFNGGTSTGGLKGVDLAGFTLKRVRLVVSDVQVSVEPQGAAYTFSYRYTLSWQFWGRVATSN